MVLILILGQIIVILATLGIIFFLIDKVIETARRKGFLSLRKQHRTYTLRRQTYKQSQNEVNKRLAKINRKARSGFGSSGLWSKLLTRLQFDTAAAERLINSLKIRYPGKSDHWYIEKAIQDLERDRR